ncbi:hypothetical protein Pmani_021967 [Petrolisthes manimaculis]|uniref:Mon2/Sec7/BIG1-like HDS domain-containing protein n=1 Tax=Petrolisthes manimaculis TaxID=1843537 RepID=A0AAE1PEZ1_9EUCA|nr:hypothetical protein Pmani_021967 [Petrolisthes manimaculis]
MKLGRTEIEDGGYHLYAGIEKTETEKDIGVVIDDKLKFSDHLTEKLNKANKIVGLIRRSFVHLEPEVFKPLFTALVRPHLEYANQIFCEYFSEVGCSPKEDIALSVVDQLRQTGDPSPPLPAAVLPPIGGPLVAGKANAALIPGGTRATSIPFQHIMMNNTWLCIKNKVVQCVSQLVRFNAINFNKSGWQTIIKVFHLTATNHQKYLVIPAFDSAKANIGNPKYLTRTASLDQPIASSTGYVMADKDAEQQDIFIEEL